MVVYGLDYSQTVRNVVKDVSDRLFAGNVILHNDVSKHGRGFSFRLTVRDSRSLGGRLGRQGQYVRAACWHVYGETIAALLRAGAVRIVAGVGEDGKPLDIRSHADNWQDRNIGSQARPLYYSEACLCADPSYGDPYKLRTGKDAEEWRACIKG